MEIFLWVLGIHIIELAILAFVFLVRKNNILTNLAIKQQRYIDSLSILISQSDDKLKELDTTGAFKADDEVGFFFENLKEIQNILNDFNNQK